MEKRKVKVSVIVPVYNVENYLEKCLDSILNQTEENIEILCIEDGSTDGSLEILRQMGKKDKRIHISENGRNQGTAYTRNAGLDIAVGEYVMFVDPDDYITEDAVAAMYGAAKKRDLDIVYGDIETVAEEKSPGEIMQSMIRHGIYEDASGTVLFDRLVQGNEMFGNIWGLYRLQFIKQNGIRFRDGIYHEDVAFAFRAILLSKRAGCMQKIFYHYFQRAGSVTQSGKLEKRLIGLIITYFDMVTFWNQYMYQLSTANKSIEKFLKAYYSMIKGIYGQMSAIEIQNPILAYVKESGFFQEEIPRGNIRISRDDLGFLKKAAKIVIYGAGKMGKAVLAYLNENNFHVDAFVVSNLDNNPRELRGIPVLEKSELDRLKDEMAVVIGVSEKYRDEILGQMNGKENQRRIQVIYG